MIADVLPWVLSALLICSMWLAGGSDRRGWWIASGSQLLWMWWIVEVEAWGLIPGTLVLTAVYVRNVWITR